MANIKLANFQILIQNMVSGYSLSSGQLLFVLEFFTETLFSSKNSKIIFNNLNYIIKNYRILRESYWYIIVYVQYLSV